jgi:signal transduction histidine kinase
MLTDLLTAVRLEKGKGLGPLGPVDVADLARAVARDFGVTGRPVEVDAPASAVVDANPAGMRRILDNLVENAHKYGAPPVRIVVETAAQGRVRIRVTDAGDGIPAEDRDRIFERFSRRAAPGDAPGLGLGLAIVRGLAESFGGSVELVEATGDGTVFEVLLRAAAERVAAV